jgi:hypothetical protein
MLRYVPSLSQFNYDLALFPANQAVGSPSSYEQTIDDCVFDFSTNVEVDTNYELQFSQLVGSPFIPIYESLNPEIATINQSGNITRVSDGTATIVVKTPWLNKKFNVTVRRIGAQTVQTLESFVSGTFAESANHLTDYLISGKSKNIYSVANFATKTYSRNPNFWGASLDLTCLPASHSFYSSGVRKGGVLFSPKHLLHAWHYALAIGTVTHFVTQQGACLERTVVDRYQVPNSDLAIATYDQELPNTIKPAKVLPADWANYVGSPYGTTSGQFEVIWKSRIPVFSQNQYRQGSIYQLSSTTDFTTGQISDDNYKAAEGRYPDSPLSDWTTELISGDSGGAVCFLYNNQPVPIFCHHNILSGPDISQYLTEINNYCDPYEVETIDLSGFTSFGS